MEKFGDGQLKTFDLAANAVDGQDLTNPDHLKVPTRGMTALKQWS